MNCCRKTRNWYVIKIKIIKKEVKKTKNLIEKQPISVTNAKLAMCYF